MNDRTAARRLLLRQFLADGTVRDQRELVRALKRRRHPVSQATVSRDLKALGVRKAPGGHYLLPASGSRPSQRRRVLAERMREFVVDIGSSGNLVVLRTPPGTAHSVAVALDDAADLLPEALGTLAGDDTIFVAARQPDGGPQLARTLQSLMEVSP